MRELLNSGAVGSIELNAQKKLDKIYRKDGKSFICWKVCKDM